MTGVLYSLRRLRQSPAFSTAVIMSLAIGLGASTVLFSLVNAAILRMIPVRAPRELVWFDSGAHGRALSYPFYEQVKDDPRFDGVLSAFPCVVLAPFAGRLLTAADHRAAVAVVSHDYGRTRLGASRSVARTPVIAILADSQAGVGLLLAITQMIRAGLGETSSPTWLAPASALSVALVAEAAAAIPAIRNRAMEPASLLKQN